MNNINFNYSFVGGEMVWCAIQLSYGTCPAVLLYISEATIPFRGNNYGLRV